MKFLWAIFSNFFSVRGKLGLLIQLLGFVLAFGISLLLTNIYGDKAYGNYVVVFSSLDVLAIFSLIGFNQLFARFIPQWSDDQIKINGLYQLGKKNALRNSIIFALLTFVFAWIYPFNDPILFWFVAIACLLLPILALTVLQSSFLYSLGKDLWTQLNEKVIKSTIFIIVILFLSLQDIQSDQIIWAFAISTLCSFGIVYFLKRNYFSNPINTVKHDFETEKKTIILLVAINLINLLFSKTDTLMVGYYLGTEFSGVNNIYLKITGIMGLAMTGMMLASSPIISEQFALGRIDLVRKELKRVSRFTFSIGVIVFLGIVLISPWVFNLYQSSLYGDNLMALYTYAVSALFNLFTGPATVVLLLSNKLKYLIYGYSLEFGLNFLLNMLLIPKYEIQGAAWATLFSEGVINGYFAYICFRAFRLNTLLIGR